MSDPNRAARYERITAQLAELIVGRSPTAIAAMATICAVLHAKMRHHLWTGFYLVAAADVLHVGPYQGAVACQVLSGRGVCLHAVRTGRPTVVDDVRGFEGHIACDERARSEIVVPVLHGERVVAVLDIDAAAPGRFSHEDIAPLQKILSLLTPYLDQLR